MEARLQGSAVYVIARCAGSQVDKLVRDLRQAAPEFRRRATPPGIFPSHPLTSNIEIDTPLTNDDSDSRIIPGEFYERPGGTTRDATLILRSFHSR